MSRPSALVLAALVACGPPLPEPLPRVVSARPTGTVPAGDVQAEFEASQPLAAEGIVDGRRIALCLAADLPVVKRLAAEPLGLGPGAPVLSARASLADGGRRAVIVPVAALVPGARYAAVLAPGVHAADGRPLLDPEGRQRAVAVEFDVAPSLAEPVRAALTEVLADAAAPEAGGEYVEVLNLGERPLDLTGFRIAKGGSGGTFTRCAIAPRAGGPVPPGAIALVSGGAYDGRYALPPGTPLYQCGSSALAGGLANDRAPALRLEDPAGGVVSSIGVGEPAPRCGAEALRRLDPRGPDAAVNLECGSPSPGAFP